MFARMMVVLLAAALAACDLPYSEGVRVGQVYKLSNKGLLCRTWEGEMAVAGIRLPTTTTDSDGNTTTSGGGNVFAFTVKNQALLAKINAAIESGARTEIKYREVMFPTICTTQSGYFVESVR